MGSIPAKRCRGVGTPRPPVYNSRVVKIDAATDGTEQRLPLEGKLAQRQLRLMRSKLSIFTMGWYDAVTFDLIRHAKRRDTFPSRGRLSLRRVLRIEFERAGHAAAPTLKNDTAYRPSSGRFAAT